MGAPAPADFSIIWQSGDSSARARVENRPGAVLVALACIGGHAGDFADWGERLAEAGIVLAGVDLPGHGARFEEPVVPPDRAIGQVSRAIAAARERWPGRPVVAVGESLGALMLLALAASNGTQIDREGGPGRPDGWIFSSLAIRTPGKISVSGRLTLLARHLFGSDRPYDFTGSPALLTEDAGELRALRDDPLRRRALPARYLFSVARLQRTAVANAASVREPALILWGEHDRSGVFAPVRSLLGVIPANLRRIEIVAGDRHLLTRGVHRRRTAERIAAWIDSTFGGFA